MNFFARRLQLAVLIFLSAALAGCALEMVPVRQSQSVESAVQTVLAKQGYYQGAIDGTLGPATSRAIRNYQRDHRLTPTGTINPVLVASMGLAGQGNVGFLPAFYYPSAYPAYSYPTYYAPPVYGGVGWGGWWPAAPYGNCWNRGYGGWGYGRYGGGGYRGYGGYNRWGGCR